MLARIISSLSLRNSFLLEDAGIRLTLAQLFGFCRFIFSKRLLVSALLISFHLQNPPQNAEGEAKNRKSKQVSRFAFRVLIILNEPASAFVLAYFSIFVNHLTRNPSLGMPIPLKIEMPRLTACPNDCENGRV